jgi:dynein heavy chain
VLNDGEMMDLRQIHDKILNVNNADLPTAFFMNPLSDFNCRLIEVEGLMETMLNVQPKDSGGGGGASRESVVDAIVVQFKNKYDSIIIELKVAEEKLQRKTGMFADEKSGREGMTYPLNVFYKFEIERFESIVGIMKRTLDDIRAAIKGEIIMTPDLNEAVGAIYNNKIPHTWLFNPAGEEISWMSASIASWYKQYEERFNELESFVKVGHTTESRYKMACMFNPQGFVNSVKQEIVRLYAMKAESSKFKIGNMFMITWAHDDYAKPNKEYF